MYNKKEFSAGIVTYNPDIIRLKENISAISPQVNEVICVDNASKNIEQIEALCRSFNNVTVIRNEENRGIATALNEILSVGSDNKVKWLLTLDQDSVCPDDIISKFAPYIHQENLGILTPCIVDRNTKDDLKRKKIKSETEKVKKCITSASLMNTDVWNDVGGFDESMFIDFVDFDYCFRMRKKGYYILRVNNVELLHQVGDTQIKRILGIPLRVTNHSVLRNYYYARNAVYMLKKHHSIAFPAMLFVRTIKIVLYEASKKEKLLAQWKGIQEGIRMKVNNIE